jgi:hypothetical protein
MEQKMPLSHAMDTLPEDFIHDDAHAAVFFRINDSPDSWQPCRLSTTDRLATLTLRAPKAVVFARTWHEENREEGFEHAYRAEQRTKCATLDEEEEEVHAEEHGRTERRGCIISSSSS